MDLMEALRQQILKIKDPEMGDFRRRAGNYLNRLAQQVDKDQKKLEKVLQLREKVLYQNFEDTEDLRQLILEDMESIK